MVPANIMAGTFSGEPSWGEFTIEGKVHMKGMGVGKDIRLVGMEVTGWVERKGHLLFPEMITGVYGLGLEVLIVGNGVNQLLLCPNEVEDAIHAQGIPDLCILSTPDECKKYNDLYHKGHKIALYTENRNFTYNDIQKMANKTANALLNIGIGIEDRVMILLLDIPAFYGIFWGAVKVGAIPIPINTMMTPVDYEFYLNDSRARLLVLSE